MHVVAVTEEGEEKEAVDVSEGIGGSGGEGDGTFGQRPLVSRRDSSTWCSSTLPLGPSLGTGPLTSSVTIRCEA